VVIYSTSRLARDLFHALAFERELARAGVEVYYKTAAGDQTSPEGRLMRHMFQALDQFEVEKLGREVRRGQTENTKQDYRNGGRAPYGYRLRREAHPDPRRARAGDQKSRLEPHPDQAPVIVEIFERYLAGSGFKEIANHLNRPGGPPPPSHVDEQRNTAGRWAMSTVRGILENPVYTGRLYWNRLDFRQVKLGEGPLIRRPTEEWIEAECRHPALIPEDWFARAQADMSSRRTRQSNPRRRSQQRFCCAALCVVQPATTPCGCRARRARGTPTTPAATAAPTVTTPPKRSVMASDSTYVRIVSPTSSTVSLGPTCSGRTPLRTSARSTRPLCRLSTIRAPTDASG
jgi:hypothetical protein